MKTNILLLFISVLAFGCKKDQTCECYRANKLDKTYSIKISKEKALDKCYEIYLNEYTEHTTQDYTCEIK